MATFFILFIIALVGTIAIAAAFQYFLKPGPWVALGYSCIASAVFVFFALSGLWEDGTRYDWGPLTALFALMLVAAFVCIKCGKHIHAWWKKRNF